MTWTKLVESLSLLFNSYVKKYAVSLVLKTIGVSGSIWASIVSFVLTKIFMFEKAKADEAARLADQKKIDDALIEKQKQAIKDSAAEPVLIAVETDILNGGRKP